MHAVHPVLLHTRHPIALMLGVVLLVAAGAMGVLRQVRSRPVSRGLLVFALAVALVVPIDAVICGVCSGCDPWWLEWFWICVP